MTTLDDVLQAEQLHYQVIKQNIDNLYLNLNSSNNSQTAQIISTINNQTNNLGGQLYTQSNRVIQSIQGQAVTLANQTLNTMRTLFNDEYKKLDSVTNILQQTINTAAANVLAGNLKTANDLNALIQYGIDKLYTVTINTSKEGKDLQLQIEGNIDRAIDRATQHDKENADRMLGTINDYIKQGNLQVSTKVADSAKDILGKLQGFSTGEPEWLTTFMEQLYAGNANNPESAGNIFLSFLSGMITGNHSSDPLSALITADPIGELMKQITAIGQIETDALEGKFKTIDDVRNAFKKIGVDNGLVGGLVQLFFAILNLGDLIKIFGEPVVVKTHQLVKALYSLVPLNEQDVITALIRNNMSYDDAVKWMDNLGHSNEDSKLILKNAFPVYTPNEIFRLGYLGKFTAQQVKDSMRKLGWNEIDTILHGYLNQPRPGIQDLIQFAVKEVYSPETYTKFGQYLEYPETFSKEAKLLGLDDEYAKQYWAAHWNLPSAGMGYDLLHRGIINEDDLKALLKALDVMPFWRDKLIKLSYNVVARVDTRRLYAYGIWDKQKVYENYLHEGYSPKDAQDLTTFTVMYDDEQDSKHKTSLQKKTHDVYIKAYNNKLVDKATAKSHLLAAGYKSQDIDLELALEDYEEYVSQHAQKRVDHTAKIISLSIDGYRKRSLSRQDLLATLQANGYSLSDANVEADLVDKEANIIFKETVIKEIQKLYFESLLDDNSTLTRLIQLGFGNAEALQIINELKILKSLDDKKPTPQQFKTAYEDGLISQSDYIEILRDMGYNDKFIPVLIGLSDGKSK